MKLSVFQLVLGLLLLALVVFFTAGLLPNVLHVTFPDEGDGLIRVADVGWGLFFPPWLVLMYLVSLGVFISGLIQFRRSQRKDRETSD